MVIKQELLRGTSTGTSEIFDLTEMDIVSMSTDVGAMRVRIDALTKVLERMSQDHKETKEAHTLSQ